MNSRPSFFLCLVASSLFAVGGGILWEAHQMRLEASQTAARFARVADNLGVAVENVSTKLGTSVQKVSDGIATLDADARQVGGKIDSLVEHVDVAVDRTGTSISKAVGTALNPLPSASATAPVTISSLFRPAATPAPTPKKP